MEPGEPTGSTVPPVPGTEVTQIIVDTMAKTFQKSLQAIVKPEEVRSKPNAYKNPIKDGSIDNWVVLMKRYLGNSQNSYDAERQSLDDSGESGW